MFVAHLTNLSEPRCALCNQHVLNDIMFGKLIVNGIVPG